VCSARSAVEGAGYRTGKTGGVSGVWGVWVEREHVRNVEERLAKK